MNDISEFPRRLRFKSWFPLFWVLSLAFFITILIRNAWICDDSMISIRSIDNLVHGLGFGYNLNERVQTFTHPLWALLLTPLFAITEEAYFTLLIPGLVLTLASVIMLSLTSRSLHMGIVVLLALIFSKAFMDYSSSGLENPLTHFLLVLFFILSQKKLKVPLIFLALVAGFATTNRMDTLLFYMPYLAWELYQSQYRLKTLGIIIAGFAPFILWELFSLVYFGFPFPNTAYTKLKIGVDKWDIIRQGLIYMKVSFKMDPLTLLLTGVGIMSVFIKGRRHLWPFALGIVLYLIYTVNVGGDFMAGRWLTAPLFMAVVLLSRWELKSPIVISALIVIAGSSLINAHSPLYCDGEYYLNKQTQERKELKLPAHGVVDEKAYYYENFGLLSKKRVKNLVSPHKGKEVPEGDFVNQYRVAFGIGQWGFRNGAAFHYIDYYALADPLLARMPCRISKGWRIGHFERMIPHGYLQSIRSHTNLIEDKELHEYYDKIHLITAGKIWSGKRFREILLMNLGHYDHLIVKERWQDVAEIRHSAGSPELRVRKKAKSPSKGWNTMQIDLDRGLMIDLMTTRNDTVMDLSLNHNTRYKLLVMNGSKELVQFEVGPADSLGQGMAVYVLPLADSVSVPGFDFVKVIPVSEEKDCTIGHIVFR